MALGPGKYDDLCTHARVTAEAEGAVLLIIGGAQGGGFAVQADLPTMARLPAMLRFIADQMERDMAPR